MKAENLSYVRQQLVLASADLSGATKGQLQAWLEDAQFATDTYRRKKPKVYDEVSEKWITLDTPPIPGKQFMAKGSAIPLVQPVEFCTASWRRALLSQDEPHKAWLLWNYSESTCFEHQLTITQWGWDEFRDCLGVKKIARKTMDRLKALVWLAAQDTKAFLAGHDVYQYGDLAALVGVKPDNWSKNYVEHWRTLENIFIALDRDALLSVAKTRSQQKAVFSQQGVAKVN